MSNNIQQFESFNHLANNLRGLQAKVQDLTGQGVTVFFQKENLSFAGNVTDSTEIRLLNACAEFERSIAGERIREGMATAKAKGQQLGAPLKLSPEQITDIKNRFSTEDKSKLAKEFGISRPTLYKLATHHTRTN